MSLILYAQFVIGNLFAVRTLQVFRARALLSTSAVTKIGTGFIAMASALIFFSPGHVQICIVLHLLLLMLIGLILFLCEQRRISKFRSEIPLFFDRWILNLRLGSALSSARAQALREHSDGFQNLLRPVFANRSANSQDPGRGHLLFAPKILHELEKIEAEPHSALARLENLRQLLRKNSEFRRKSGQALRQTAIQMVVMLVLLFAMTLFSLNRYGWRRCGDLIIYAQLLSWIGVASMWFVARKAKWKI